MRIPKPLRVTTRRGFGTTRRSPRSKVTEMRFPLIVSLLLSTACLAACHQDVSIDNAITDAQRDLLKHYYTSALALREHGIATGEAGTKVASTAISSVAKGLSSGNTSNIDSEVNASAAKVEAMAANICMDLQQIHITQDALASQLDAFRPYAVIKANKVDDCSRDLKDLHHS